MVADLALVVSYLYPAAVIGPDGPVTILDAGAGPTITRWDNSLGAQPSDATLTATASDPAYLAYKAALPTTTARALAQTTISGDPSALGKVLRAEAAVLVDEINVLREWIVSFKAAVAASTSLANMQTRVAALPDLPDRTLAQAKTAIQTKITNGVVD